MIITKTKLEGVYIIDLEPRGDQRGYFTRVFAKEELIKHGIAYNIAHINRSSTEKRGTIRGLHFQKAPKQEDKIVQCLQGSIFDVAVDLRKKSKTYGQWVGEVLSAENKRMLLVPKGFAHGFQTLEKNSSVEYLVSQYYYPEYESGLRWDDPYLNIDWPIKKAEVSEKDAKWPFLKKL
jgi:dTDP-4-dehydrorhamnose 3,5-epimerase